MKQRIRNIISVSASYTEIFISAITLIGIMLLSVIIFKDIKNIVFSLMINDPVDVDAFLADSLQLIIGIEFIKMLSKHTPGSTIEVLLFALARKLITSHQLPMIDLLIGVTAIALLFGIRKYLNISAYKDFDGLLVNAETKIDKVNSLFNINLPLDEANTLAGIFVKTAVEQNKPIQVGCEIRIKNVLLTIHSMDEDLIKQIQISLPE